MDAILYLGKFNFGVIVRVFKKVIPFLMVFSFLGLLGYKKIVFVSLANITQVMSKSSILLFLFFFLFWSCGWRWKVVV